MVFKRLKYLKLTDILVNMIFFVYFFVNLFTSEVFYFFDPLRYSLSIICSILCCFFILLRKTKLNVITLVYVVFMITTTIGQYWQIQNFGTIYLSVYFRKLLLIPVIIYLNSEKKSNIFHFFIKLNLFHIFVSLFLFFKNVDSFGRFNSTFAHPNYYAAYCLLVITICFLLYRSKDISINSMIVLISINLFFIVASGSRTTAAITAIIIFYNLLNFRIKKKYLFFLYSLMIIVAFLLLFFSISYADYLDNLRIFNLDYGVGENRVNSFQWRLLKWKYTFESWNTPFKIFFGTGTQGDMFFQYIGFPLHNEYLRFLFNYGIFGTLFIFIMTVLYIKKLICLDSDLQNLKIFYVSFLIILLISAFTSNLFLASETYSIYLFFIFSIFYWDKKGDFSNGIINKGS